MHTGHDIRPASSGVLQLGVAVWGWMWNNAVSAPDGQIASIVRYRNIFPQRLARDLANIISLDSYSSFDHLPSIGIQITVVHINCRTSSSTPWPTITLQSPWLHFGNPRHGPRYRTEGGGVAVMNPDQCATHKNSSNGHPIIIPAGTIATHPSREVTCPMNDSASLFWSINITLVVIHVTFSSPGWVLLLSPLLLLRYGALIPNYYAFNIQWGCVPRAADTSHLPAQDYYAVRKKWH